MATTSFRPIAAYLSALVMCALNLAWSQPVRLRFDHITTRDGLSQDIVTAIVQDARGFMWFGTKDGLNRYDGYDLRTYTNGLFDSTSLSGNSIIALFVDAGGRLWVSANGLNLYDDAPVPTSLTLEQNYPNPFNPSTTISFSVPEDGHATLKVFDVLGQEVATLVNGNVRAGYRQQATFDAKGVASGIYIARLESGGKRLTQRMQFLK